MIPLYSQMTDKNIAQCVAPNMLDKLHMHNIGNLIVKTNITPSGIDNLLKALSKLPYENKHISTIRQRVGTIIHREPLGVTIVSIRSIRSKSNSVYCKHDGEACTLCNILLVSSQKIPHLIDVPTCQLLHVDDLIKHHQWYVSQILNKIDTIKPWCGIKEVLFHIGQYMYNMWTY